MLLSVQWTLVPTGLPVEQGTQTGIKRFHAVLDPLLLEAEARRLPGLDSVVQSAFGPCLRPA